MIDLESVKLLNLKNSKKTAPKTAPNKLSINDFQNLLQEKTAQEKTAQVKYNPQLQNVNSAAAYLALPAQGYKAELLKRAKDIIQKLELLKLQILKCASLEQSIQDLEHSIESLELLDDDSDDIFASTITRAKVEIAKYKNN